MEIHRRRNGCCVRGWRLAPVAVVVVAFVFLDVFLVHFLILGTAVLKPYFNLPLAQRQLFGEFRLSTNRNVTAEDVFLLELQSLTF